jgi:1,2-dihydroxy-3-keto-5-methylthiopentene dioxygenase
MSRLTVYSETDPARPLLDTADAGQIAEALAKIEVRFERWPVKPGVGGGSSDADVLAAYADEIGELKRAYGYQAVDVARVRPDHPDRATMRRKFLSEHRHAEDEVRVFVDGAALFYLRDAGRVHLVVCEAGDMISVPAGIRHWFDMGAAPRFTAIRLFASPDGWVAAYTGDPIAEAFPRFEAAAA